MKFANANNNLMLDTIWHFKVFIIIHFIHLFLIYLNKTLCKFILKVANCEELS